MLCVSLQNENESINIHGGLGTILTDVSVLTVHQIVISCRMGTWMDVLMAPGVRSATSRVHMVELFFVPTTTSRQTIGLTPVETRLEQLQQRTVRSTSQ